MSDLYPSIDRWAFPEASLAATAAAVLPAGRRGFEAGVFWLGDRSRISRLRAVVVPSGPGVEERPGRWRVSPEVFGAISRWALPRRNKKLGVVHTHPEGIPPRLSLPDRTESVQVPGILAVVIGNGGADRIHTDWGWYVYEKTDYGQIARHEISTRVEVIPDGEFEVCSADATGVRESRWRSEHGSGKPQKTPDTIGGDPDPSG